MLKKVMLATLVLLLVPAFCMAACPYYEVGYKGKAEYCSFGLTNPVPGVAVKLTVGQDTVSKVTDGAGKYCVKKKVNNCDGAAEGTAIGYYTQSWSVDLDMGAAYAGTKRTCSTSATFICCCPQCVQSIIKECSIIFRFCCNGATNS
jgi:hypothetical protein